MRFLVNKRRHRRKSNQPTTQPNRTGGGGGRSLEQKFSQIAPAPLKPLSKIRFSGPCGSGLNPLAPPKQENFAQYRRKEKRNYGIIFFDSFLDAKKQREAIQAASVKCDQLNVVIKAEGDMDDPDLLSIDQKVKVFAGAAWTLIHERRMNDGWYTDTQE
jgi:hypothetical protein